MLVYAGDHCQAHGAAAPALEHSLKQIDLTPLATDKIAFIEKLLKQPERGPDQAAPDPG